MGWHRAALVAALLLAGCRQEVPPATGPNVILVTMESLRTDHVGAYGGASIGRPELPLTPSLDALAAQATVYENAHSVTSWTLASHASLFTGLYPTAHQTTGPSDRLGDSYRTLAEILAGAGYETAAVVSGPYLRPPYNLLQGFDRVDDSPSALIDKLAHSDVTNPRMEQAIERTLRERRDRRRPLFLFAYFWDPHYDFLPPAPYDSMFLGPGDEAVDARSFDTNPAIRADMQPAQLRWLMAQYAGEIRWTDGSLGRMFDLLRREGLWDDSLVIVTSDHGEEFFDHGEKGHKNNLHAETVRVPLIVKYPGQVEGVRDARLVSLVDVLSTVLEVSGVEDAGPHEGRSLRAEADPDRAVRYELHSVVYYRRPDGSLFSREARHAGVRAGRFKLLWSDEEGGRELLYDVSEDPDERHALQAADAVGSDALRARYEREAERSREIAAHHRPGGAAELSDDEIEQLRELGYLEAP